MSRSKTPKEMPIETRARFKAIRLRGKTGGGPIFPEESKFLQDCYKKWPEECRVVGREVFVESAPFGNQLTDK